jgi:hypothetical protein
MPRRGRAVNVNLSVEAREGWQIFADEHGTDVTALLEVIGLRLITSPRSLRCDEIGRSARQLSQRRRRRS